MTNALLTLLTDFARSEGFTVTPNAYSTMVEGNGKLIWLHPVSRNGVIAYTEHDDTPLSVEEVVSWLTRS